ncbi:dienelactone hydrolase family protein [Janibacter melonis]|uniref:dienelactone hydrolase family protein n=1 Tax=Janibacter melonis TaxID=262209 RepID=UPI002094CFBD|nr:dienelactone hydrolase family protein [Janibacter melonis]
MAEVLLYHHIQGLTPGVVAFADALREAGHTVHTPDLFEGRTFASIEEGFGYARGGGFDVVRRRGADAVYGLGEALVYAGFSFGVTSAQQLAQTRPGARGALLLCSCMPVAEHGERWPQHVPVQVHGKEGDEFFDEDLPAARELVASSERAELFVYPGDEHLFADSSLDAYDPDAAALLLERVRAFLAPL